MTSSAPLFASERTAARLLDMKPAEFRELVQKGALPGPCRFDKWDMEHLAAIMRGNMIARNEDLEP